MSQHQHCLINQPACGRIQGNPICPKCGMDERVLCPGQADREAAQTAGLARYWEAHAKGLVQQVRQAQEGARAALPSPRVQPPRSAEPEAPPQPAKGSSAKGAWATMGVALVVAVLGVGAYFGFRTKPEQPPVAQASAPIATLQMPSGAAADAAKAAPQPFEPEMVRIRAGSFTMGSPASEPGRDTDEGPQRTVRVAAFELGKTEVTFAQWDACVADGGCSHKPADAGRGRGNWPVINVSWDDITQQYIPWLNRKTGKTYRLPTEAEWEYAARVGCSTPLNVDGLCGDQIQPIQANFDGGRSYNGSAKSAHTRKTAVADNYTANGWSLHNMEGNVWEWVQDCYAEGYDQGQPTDGGAHRATDGSCEYRVLRGGSWYGIPRGLRPADRDGSPPDDRDYYRGFRLARTVS